MAHNNDDHSASEIDTESEWIYSESEESDSESVSYLTEEKPSELQQPHRPMFIHIMAPPPPPPRFKRKRPHSMEEEYAGVG